MWNRTINLAGGPVRSLPADLENEFTQIRSLKSLQQMQEGIIPTRLVRHSQVVGSMGKVLDQICVQALDTQWHGEFIRKTKIDISKDLHAFTELIGKEKLFTITPGREFKAFP